MRNPSYDNRYVHEIPAPVVHPYLFDTTDKFSSRVCMIAVKQNDAAPMIQAFMIAAARGGYSPRRTVTKRRTRH